MTTRRKPDAYDRAAARLQKVKNFADAVRTAWENPLLSRNGSLFSFVSPDRCGMRAPNGQNCGCLTQVRGGAYIAYTHDLTEKIREDRRLPKGVSKIRPHHLHVFASWQRRIDRALGRTPPR